MKDSRHRAADREARGQETHLLRAGFPVDWNDDTPVLSSLLPSLWARAIVGRPEFQTPRPKKDAEKNIYSEQEISDV